MIDLKEFRKANNLLQKDVAEYLQVSREFISLVESGKTPLPYVHLRKLLDNEPGWDVSMLSISSKGDHIQQNGGQNNIGKIDGEYGEILALRKEVEMLRQQLDETKAQRDKFWDMIKKLMEK